MDPRRWARYLRDRWEALRGSYWFVPGLMALVSAGCALAAIELDRRFPVVEVSELFWFRGVSAEAARSVLSTIAGSMMTVTGVVFSITIVALTLTSSQFGPRLLRTFFRDRSTQFSLGFFLSTFLYSLLVLRAAGSPERVPNIATAGAVGLAIVSLFVLIFFIHHTASSLQASSVIAAVARELHTQIELLFPATHETEREEAQASRDEIDGYEADAEAASVVSAREGYVRILDEESIVSLACGADLVIQMQVAAGSFVSKGACIARVFPESRSTGAIEAEILDCCVLGDYRTPVQDICFLTQQLGQMAVRALSPGINDPKTAIECIQRLGSVVGAISGRDFPAGERFDDDGSLRAIFRPVTFEEFLMSCFDSIRHHGAKDPQVAIAMLDAVEAGACGQIGASRQKTLARHANEVWIGFESTSDSHSTHDRELVRAALDATLQSLDVRSPEA